MKHFSCLITECESTTAFSTHFRMHLIKRRNLHYLRHYQFIVKKANANLNNNNNNCHFSYPFEWRTPFGYVVAFIEQTVCCTCITVSVHCVLCLLIGFCRITTSFIADIESELQAINEGQIIGNEKVLKQKLHNIIQFHSNIKL